MADEDTKDETLKEPEAGEPGYYSPPSVDVGVTKSQPNEVKPAGAAESAGEEA